MTKPVNITAAAIGGPATATRHFAGLMTEEQLIHWIRMFRRKEGRYPTPRDRIVWDWIDDKWAQVPKRNWNTIDQNLRHGRNGLQALKGHTLSTFRRLHGLDDDLTPARIAQLMELHREKTGSYPFVNSPDVWDKDETGAWQAMKPSWDSINQLLKRGDKKLKPCRGMTLKSFRDKLRRGQKIAKTTP